MFDYSSMHVMETVHKYTLKINIHLLTSSNIIKTNRDEFCKGFLNTIFYCSESTVIHKEL